MQYCNCKMISTVSCLYRTCYCLLMDLLPMLVFAINGYWSFLIACSYIACVLLNGNVKGTVSVVSFHLLDFSSNIAQIEVDVFQRKARLI